MKMSDKMEVLNMIKAIIDYAAIIIMIWGVFLTIIKIGKAEYKLKAKDLTYQVLEREKIRVFLGSYILLGLEMLIVADLIAIIINPSYQDLLMLVIIVVVRTTISFFLGREMKEATQDIKRLEHENIDE